MLTENFNIRKGFQFKERFERAPFEQRWDEPTYLTFKIEFDFDDVYSRLTSEMSFDDIPQGLLILPVTRLDSDPGETLELLVKELDPYDGQGQGVGFEESLISSDSGYNQRINKYIGNVSDDKRYSAIEYLLRRNEDYRAWCLARFLQGLAALQNEYQYYFQEIQGLDALSGLTPDKGWQIDKNAVITIKCLEGLDQKVKYLFYLYREAAWDAEYQRWILPDIYRYFKMNIFISEIRTFHQSNFAESGAAADLLTSIATKYVNKWANQFLDKVADWTKGAIDVNVNMDLQRLNIISTAVPITCFRCEMCDFDIARNMYSDSYSINNDKQEESVLKIRVKKCEILNHWKIGGKDGILLKNLKSWLERQYGPDRAHAAYGFIQEGMHDEMWFNGTENLSDDDKSKGYSKVIADGWGMNAAKGVLDALSGANGSGILDMAAGIYSTVKNAVAERNATKGEYVESAATNPSDEQESALISLVLTQMYANAMAAPAGTLSQAELEALRIAAHPSERLSDSSVYETIINQVTILPHTHEPLFQDETIDGSVVQSAMPSFNMAEVEVGRFKDVSLRDVSVYGFADTSVESPDPSMMLADTSFRDVPLGELADTSFREVPLGELADTSFREVSVGKLADTSFRGVPLGRLKPTSFREVSVGKLADTSFREVPLGGLSDTSFREVSVGVLADVSLTGSGPGGFADVSLTGSEPGGFMDVSIWSPGVDPILWPLGIPGDADASTDSSVEIGEYEMLGLRDLDGVITGTGSGSFRPVEVSGVIHETSVGGLDGDYSPSFAEQEMTGTYNDPDMGEYSMTGVEPGDMAEVIVSSPDRPAGQIETAVDSAGRVPEMYETAVLSPVSIPAEVREQQIAGYEADNIPVREAQITGYGDIQSEVRETLITGPDYSPMAPQVPSMQAPAVQTEPGDARPQGRDYAPVMSEAGVSSPDPDMNVAEHEVSSPVPEMLQGEAEVDSPSPDMKVKEAEVDSPSPDSAQKETKVESVDYKPVHKETRVESPEYTPELKEAAVESADYEPARKEARVESEEPSNRMKEAVVVSPYQAAGMREARVESPAYEPRLRPLLVGEDGIPVSGELVEQEVSSPEPEMELDRSRSEEPVEEIPEEPRILSAADMFRSNYTPALSRAEIIDKYAHKEEPSVVKETVASPWSDQTVKDELRADGTVGGMLDAYSRLKEEGRIGRPDKVDDPKVGSNDPKRPNATDKGRRINKQIL